MFFKSNDEQKLYINKKLDRMYPNFKTGGYYLRSYLKKYINENSIILDAGCGKGGIIGEFQKIPKMIIGVDLDKGALEKNQIVTKKYFSDLNNIPLENNSVDIVISQFVLEHLSKPLIVFKEVYRVLKPGGVFIFLTPNIFNPIMFLSKIFPFFLHKILRTKLLKKQEETHQTYYKVNTYKKLLKLGKYSDFIDCKIKRAGNPEYFGFCKLLIPISILFEKIINNKFLSFLKMYLVGCFVKK